MVLNDRIWSGESGRVSYGRWIHEHDGKHHPPHADDKCEEEQTPVMARIIVVTPFLRSQDACAISTTVTSNRHSSLLDATTFRRAKLSFAQAIQMMELSFGLQY
jgi:hypothetical protein